MTKKLDVDESEAEEPALVHGRTYTDLRFDAILPEDPVADHVRRILGNSRTFARRVQDWLHNNPGEVPALHVTLAQREAREGFKTIAEVRLKQSKQLLAERIAAAKLPAVDEMAIAAEIDRLVGERLRLLDGKSLYALASARLEEERKAREAETPGIGNGVAGAITDGK